MEPVLDPEYIRLKREKVRRVEEEYLRYYEPSPTQLAFHKSQAKIRGIFAGNQFGKSMAGAIDLIWTMGKVHPYRKNYVGPVYARDCCVTFSVMQSVLIPTYRRLLPRKPCLINGLQWPGLLDGDFDKAWDSEGRSIHLADGSFVEFKSYDQPTAVFAGPPRHFIRMDEEPPEAIYNENQARQITTGVNLVFTMTPLNYSQWLFADIYQRAAKDPDVECFKGPTSENRFADPAVLKSMEEKISDPIERAARLYGDFTFSAGRVWKEYGEHNACDPILIPKHWRQTLIIDPHPEKACGVNVIALDPEKLQAYVVYEADIAGEVDEICDKIKADLGGFNITRQITDPSALQKASTRGQGSLYDMFRTVRNFPCLQLAENDRNLGLEEVRKWVKDRPTGPRLRVFRSCPTTHFQLSNYSWKPPLASGETRGKPEVVKKNDEHCDNIRYWAMDNRFTSWDIATDEFEGFSIRALA